MGLGHRSRGHDPLWEYHLHSFKYLVSADKLLEMIIDLKCPAVGSQKVLETSPRGGRAFRSAELRRLALSCRNFLLFSCRNINHPSSKTRGPMSRFHPLIRGSAVKCRFTLAEVLLSGCFACAHYGPVTPLDSPHNSPVGLR